MLGMCSTSVVVGIGITLSLCALSAQTGDPNQRRARELGISPGVMQNAPLNAITDVTGVAKYQPEWNGV